ncbi:MAG: hypothetical protein Q8P67_00255, partial [archaeon]|nr:hypothetical protein [archaeon]
MAAAINKGVPPYAVVVQAGSKYSPKKLNIDGGDDPFGRYQVPQLLCQVVGKGKMIKTMFLNLENVAEALHVHPAYIPAWFAYEIGASFKYEAKEPPAQRGSISGDYPAANLSEHMQKFIKTIILCKNCGLPELWMRIAGQEKSRRVEVKCDSCGATVKLDIKMIKDKFKNYILNNPPPAHKSIDANAERKKKQIAAAKQSIEEDRKSPPSGSEVPSSEPPEVAPTMVVGLDGEIINLDAVAEAAAKMATTDASAAADKFVWLTDASEEAAAARQAELVPDAVKQLIGSSVEENFQWIGADESNPLVILQEGVARSIDHAEIVALLFSRVFKPCATLGAVVAALKTSAKHLCSFFSKDARFQIAFLDNLAPFLSANDLLRPKSQGILHAFYEADVLD